jgi:hypothetical protein
MTFGYTDNSVEFYLVSVWAELLLLLALQSLVDLSLFKNCPPLVSILLRTSPIPYAHVLQIFLNWLKPPQRGLSNTSTAFWFL